MWVEMNVLWGNCNVLCDLVTQWYRVIVTTGVIKTEVRFFKPDLGPTVIHETYICICVFERRVFKFIQNFSKLFLGKKVKLAQCYFGLLNRYWGIVTVLGSFLKTGDLGWSDPHPSP